MKLSICIPTHERHALLEARCLPSLLQQTRLPDEVIVADSSTGAHVSEFYERWAQRFQPIKFTYVRTEGRSVAKNRWMAFSHSSGDLIFFVDDDMQLTEKAVAAVEAGFEVCPGVTGVGLKIYYEGSIREPTISERFRAWWLNDTTGETNSISPGGLNACGRPVGSAKPIPVQWFAGGAMCFSREALSVIGSVPGVDELFALRIGASEDAILSRQAGLRGQLILLTEPLAWHPEKRTATSTALTADGWRRGLRDTFTRAHVLRWLAQDKSAVMHEWLRSITLDFLRAVKTVLRKPFTSASWLRLLGFLYGCILTLLIWRRIPDIPNEVAPLDRKWLFV